LSADLRTLTAEEARAFYDRFGAKQDSQAFYEATALNELIANGHFRSARSVFEFGCGTGRFAFELLQHQLPTDSVYHGVDISSTMVEIARARLAPFAARATASLAGAQPIIPLADASVDRVVATYVLDLLPDPAVRQVLAEAERVLRSGGMLCVAGITHGVDPLSRVVMGAWQWLFARNPMWVGGCRPTNLTDHLRGAQWRICFHDVVVAWGVASEVLVASPMAESPRAGETNA
jgi:ubiquinone/menaquinone biosynthesis C-methylase UbiE